MNSPTFLSLYTVKKLSCDALAKFYTSPRFELPKAAFSILQGCYRQSWYLTPQLAVLALADSGSSQGEREGLARALHSCPRIQISMGKPELPYLSWSSDHKLPPLASLVTSDSWTLFDRLGLEGTNVRIKNPAYGRQSISRPMRIVAPIPQ